MEIQHLKDFEKYLKEKKHEPYPEWWPENETLRMLHANHWNYAKAHHDIVEFLRVRATMLPIRLEDIHARIIRSGFFTVYGRDIHHRCVTICKPLNLNRLGITDYEAIKTACLYACFYVMNYMYKDGIIENNVAIIDLEYAQPWSLPIKALKTFNDTMSKQFRCKMAKIYVVNTNKTFLYAWKAIRIWLDEMIANKVELYHSNTSDEIKQMIPADQLLEEYGGNAKAPEVYWPPFIPGSPSKPFSSPEPELKNIFELQMKGPEESYEPEVIKL